MDRHAETHHPDISRLLASLEAKLEELDRLQHDIGLDAQALALAASSTAGTGPLAGREAVRSVFSVRDAAAELGVSVSMLHKLLKERRRGHLKVGAP